MLHIYRQVRSLHDYETFVMTKALQNSELFPFRDIELIPKPPSNPLRHGWLKWVKQRPPIVYRGEYQMLSNLLERRGADLMHIYFGHTGVHLLPFIERWHKPCVVSFHGADVAQKKDIRDYGPKLRDLFNAVPLVLARSRSLADRLLTLGCPPERLRINRTGVPLDEFPFIRREAPTRWPLEIHASLPPHSEERRGDLALRLRHFPEGVSERSAGRGRQGSAPIAPGRTRGGARDCRQGSFPRVSLPGGIDGAVRQFACFPSSQRDTAGSKPGRHPELHSRSDVDGAFGSGHPAWRNSGSRRARPIAGCWWRSETSSRWPPR